MKHGLWGKFRLDVLSAARGRRLLVSRRLLDSGRRLVARRRLASWWVPVILVSAGAVAGGTAADAAGVADAAGSLPAPAAACTPVDLFAHHTVNPAAVPGGVVLAGADMGASIATGDFDHDGFADVAVGAPGDTVGGATTGTVYVFGGSPAGLGTGIRLSETDLGAGNENGDRFGASLAAGDFDGDGFADLAVGIPGEAVGSNAGAGAVGVFTGSAGGLSTGVWLSQTTGGGANEAGDGFGTSLAAGDIDGDGFAELAIGTPGEAPSGGTVHSGGVYVYAGSSTGLVKGWTTTQANLDAGSNESGDEFGAAVAVGNVTGDGHPDLVVGAPGEAPGADPADSGAIYVMPGSAAPPSTGFARSQNETSGANETGDRFGSALALGDFDDDQFADIAVGVPGEAPDTAPAGGGVVVFPGAASRVATGYWLTENRAGEVIGAGDRFGAALGTGDVDGDGFADLLVGAPGKDSGGRSDAGVTFLFGGRPRDAGSTRSLELGRRVAQPDVGFGNETGDAFGSAVALGDVTGDGRSDAVIGASGEAPIGQPASGDAVEVSGLSTGVALGAVVGTTTDTSTRLWVRGNHAGTFQVQYRPTGTSGWLSAPPASFGGAAVDYTAVVGLTGLVAGTSYDYRVSVGCLVDHLGQAGFSTLPPTTASTIRFGYGADLRQPSAFRTSTSERQQPFSLFGPAGADQPAFMLFGGDQIYADAGSRVPVTAADYFATYRENWGEANFRAFTQRVPSMMMWDDHELFQNWDSGTAAPYPAASTAFDAYQGALNPAPFRTGVKYFSFRAGPADFFVTDGRTFRSDDAAPDDASKTMLGAVQLADLEAWLSASTATFKFIVTADPFADINCNLTTPNHDSWCGFRTERKQLFDYIAAHDIHGVIAISGDHHWSGAFTGDDTTAKIYEFMPNPIGNDPATPASAAPDMLWHYETPQEVYGVFDVDTSVTPATLTVRFKGTGGATLRTFVVDENGGISQH